MKKQFYRAAAATVLGLSLTTGMVAADNSGTIGTTGPNSDNQVKADTDVTTKLTNNNNVSASNSNSQSAYTGDAKVFDNTTGGDATSGGASNDNSTSADLSVDNSTSSAAALSGGGSWNADAHIADPGLTGPNSTNKIVSDIDVKTTVTNNNNLSVSNSSSQSASSGDAKVFDNTTGGDATSGNAENTNSSTFTFNVTN